MCCGGYHTLWEVCVLLSHASKLVCVCVLPVVCCVFLHSAGHLYTCIVLASLQPSMHHVLRVSRDSVTMVARVDAANCVAAAVTAQLCIHTCDQAQV